LDLRAHVCSLTGYTWDEVGRLTLPRIRALMNYWAKHPPTHVLVAAYLGFKGGGTQAQQAPEQASALHELAAGAPLLTGAPKLDNSAWLNRQAQTSEA